MNLKLIYLYRDAGNFKNWGEVVFGNPSGLSVEQATEEARGSLIDEEFFIAESVGLDTLYFEEQVDRLDHGWHEFSAFKITLEEPPDRRTVDGFLVDLFRSRENVPI